MAFSSLIFLLCFFPAAILLYFLPGRSGKRADTGRKLILLGLSLIFYAWGEPRRIALLAASAVLNFGLLRLWARCKGKTKRLVFWGALLIDLLLLVWGKYLADSLPLGLSFYTFRLLSAWFDCRREEPEREPGRELSFLDFALYISFFPQLISGPIARFEDFMPQLRHPEAKLENLYEGLKRFLPGLFIKVLLADPIYALWQRLLASDPSAPGAAEAWLASIFYSLYIYLDFSSYSDMAIGLGKMFGFNTKENFRQPYAAVSISGFWRRWHISLSSWFRDYVYIPLGGNRRGPARQVMNIMIVWLLTGIWHGSSLNFLFWGLYYALWLLLEKFVLSRFYERWPRVLRHLFTLAVVNFAWVLFAFPKKDELFAFIGAMFGANGPGNGRALYILLSHTAVILAALFFSTPLPEKIRELWKRSRCGSSPWTAAAAYVLTGLLLLLSLAFIVDQSFSSFLYFNF